MACSKRSLVRSSFVPPYDHRHQEKNQKVSFHPRNEATYTPHVARARSNTKTYIALDKLQKINVPELKGNRVAKEIDTTLVHLVTVLEELVLLQKVGIVDNDLRVGDLDFQNLVVHSLCRLHCSN